ncbi:SRPBCC family protein [Pedobacter sp. Du54]|uniref:SRPBCC family protein n=1 Tax=Pedobacter anseongensis TaxID=3133439 RepID=UPI0030A92DD1
MNIVLSILLFLAVFVAFLLFLALVVKKKYFIQREIVINKPSDEVFDYIRYMRNQEKYNKWVLQDPNVKIEYKGIDGTEGFTSIWEGNKQAGKGEQEIKKIVENGSINFELRFEKPFKNVGQTYMHTTAVGKAKTNVKWTMEGRNSYPMNLFNLFIDNLLGRDLSTSLDNLKRILES